MVLGHGDCRVVFVSMLVGQGFRWEVGGGSLLIRGGVDEVSSSCSRAAPELEVYPQSISITTPKPYLHCIVGLVGLLFITI